MMPDNDDEHNDTAGYADAAPAYWQAGWRSILPLPPGAKQSPPVGYTGRSAAIPSYPDIMTWADGHPGGNLCLRLPDGVIGIDVDAYDDKTGAATLVHAERRWGALPETVRSTSRYSPDDPISGIYLYRVPLGTVLRGDITFDDCGDIEIVQPHHRYVVAAPSIHPTGRRYGWYDDDGPTEIPHPDTLPNLPPAWIDGLRAPTTPLIDGLPPADITACLTPGDPAPPVAARLAQAFADLNTGTRSRHDTVMAHALALLRYGKQGHAGVAVAIKALEALFVSAVTRDNTRRPDEAAAEYARMITNNGAAALIGQPCLNDWTAAIPPADDPPPANNTIRAETVPPANTLETLEQDFWDARPELALIYQAALARMASPWAVLACCAARILCLAPPAITLPPCIGDRGSLNWFAAIAAKSGGGKGAAMTVAARLLPADIIRRPIGSGEGMIEAYQRSSTLKNPPPPVIAILFDVDEIDSLGALGNRSGQTTTAIIRQGFSGERLGYSYRGRQSETVPAHTYRMTVVAGVQPERAGILFDHAGGGMPQRFMWFPGRDKRITADPPDWPTDWNGDKRIPILSERDFAAALGTISLPAHAIREIRECRAATMNGDDDNLDSHAMFCREKLAYALALMNARTEITAEDWRLSGIAANVSDWWRRKTHDAYNAAKIEASRERGMLRGHENDERMLSEAQASGAHIGRILNLIIRKIEKNGPSTRGALYRDAPSRDRPRLDAALTAGATTGFLVQRDGKWCLP